MGPTLKARFGSENIQDRNLAGMNHRDSGIARKIGRDYGIERSMNHPDSGISRKIGRVTGSNGPDVLEIPRGTTSTFLWLYCVTFWHFAK